MTRVHRTLGLVIRGLLIGGLALAASACGKSGGGAGTVVTPPVTTVACDSFLEQFGLGFCIAYKAAANTEPREVQSNDIVSVDPTKEPITVP